MTFQLPRVTGQRTTKMEDERMEIDGRHSLFLSPSIHLFPPSLSVVSSKLPSKQRPNTAPFSVTKPPLRLSPLSVNLGPFYSTMGAPSPRAPVARHKGIGKILFMCPPTRTRGRRRNRHKTAGTKIQISPPSMHLYHKGKRAPAAPASAGGGGGGKMKYRRSRVIFGAIHL